jgi:hypothetical protein
VAQLDYLRLVVLPHKFFLENQELVDPPFIRLANRQSSIVEYGVCGIFSVISGAATRNTPSEQRSFDGFCC